MNNKATNQVKLNVDDNNNKQDWQNISNMTPFERFKHRCNVFLGREKEQRLIRRKMPQVSMYGSTKVVNLGCVEEGISYEKRENGWFDQFVKVCNNLARLVKKLLKLFAILTACGLGILALREIAPGVAKQVAPLYEFMDQYAVPAFNTMIQKGLDYLKAKV